MLYIGEAGHEKLWHPNLDEPSYRFAEVFHVLASRFLRGPATKLLAIAEA